MRWSRERYQAFNAAHRCGDEGGVTTTGAPCRVRTTEGRCAQHENGRAPVPGVDYKNLTATVDPQTYDTVRAIAERNGLPVTRLLGGWIEEKIGA